MNPELLLKAWWGGAVFKEISVPFRKRTRGTGTGTRWPSIARSVRDICVCWEQTAAASLPPLRVAQPSGSRRPCGAAWHQNGVCNASPFHISYA
jgi:hypothetical protein